MDPVALAVDKLKAFAKSSQDFVDDLIHRRDNLPRRNPIQILKRLQQEAFTDLMKLRDRQDKVERVLSFYKTSKGSPFQEASTHVRGEVDLLGALLVMDDVDEKNCDALSRAGIRTGIDSRFTFETTINQKDTLAAEFVASQKDKGYLGDVSGQSLFLEKVSYKVNASDWLSVVAIPLGARCRDVAFTTISSHQGKGLTELSSHGPPLLNQHSGSGIGIGVMVRKSNVVASLAQFVSGLGMQPGSDSMGHCLSTFGQVVCQLPRGIKLSLLGLHQMPKSLSQHVSLGSPLTIPVRLFKRHRTPETVVEVEASTSSVRASTLENVSAGSIALMLESELDEITRIEGWIEMDKSNPKHLQWAVTVSDDSEDSFGWAISLSGMVGDPTNRDRFQAESYLKLNLGKRFSLKPGLTYVADGNARLTAFMLRSNWSL
ncbi:uncharacterized protein LOC132171489 [Corylus avellana]|uniref:uncharacterized protein LOC132171489 n=1 Tax=Corylus avellana TaxID=13451 RepID=UPI001E210D38|nr:uncharacterized protein LOC132171489 [Corylus avellana]